MRFKLKSFSGKRMRFVGTVGRISRCKVYGDRTVMLKNITTEEGEWGAHHVWFKNAIWSEKYKVGHKVSFKADVVRYKKKGHLLDTKVRDFKLVNAAMVSVVEG